MDSPQQTKSTSPSSTAAPSSSFSPVQESPFSIYVSNLSPIKHDKAPHVAPRFLGLNSPPLVFTSPRINTLKSCQSSSFEVSRNGKGDDLGLTVSELRQELIVDIKKDDDTNDSMSVQPSSSSGCVDEYLADPVDVDCANSEYSVDVNSLRSSNVLESSANGLLCSKDLESDDKRDVGKEADVARLLSGHSEQGVETFDVLDPLKINNDQRGDRGISDECQQIESDDKLVLSSKKEVEDDGHGCDGFLQLQHGSLQMVHAYDDFVENAEGVKDNPFYEMTHDLEEANEHRGMSRRCLQFGETQPESTANCSSSPNLANVVITSTSTSSKTGHVGLSATSRKGQLVNLSQLASNMITQSYDHRSSLTVSKPSGIGLHLNGVINAIPAEQGGIASMKLEVDSMGTRGIKSTSITNYQSMENMESCSDAFENVSTAPYQSTENMESCSDAFKNVSTAPYQSTENMESCSDAFENVSTALQDGTLEAKVHAISGSAAPESLCTMESTECHTTLDTKKRLNSGDGESNEMFNKQSPKKKRKKLSDSTYSDGCKRCNCKKSKCLKLYCDCFAAGIYCAEPCSCQGCFNKPEYEDKVLETRHLIESRNPLAFAPKVVKPSTEVPVNSRDDGSWKTPSSARHKRGCNCKRSMCLKKYCECYQANVGCSLGCRCEGCKNVYGKKEDYSVIERIVNRGDGQLLERRVSAKKDFLHSEIYNPHYLTPMTPSVQCSDQGKNAPVSGLLNIRCFPSLESDPTNSSFAKSPRSSNSNDMLVETTKENLYIGSYCEGINNNNAEMLADECHQTPLPNHPSFIIGSSSSSSKATELLNKGPISGCFTSGGLRWCSSPITPKSPVDGTKELERLDSDELFDILVDDTPEMLKDTSTPFKSVKASSPNGKRVSPLHRLHQLGSSSSGPLRSGRKFMLKAVPSFPPLTPCINSKGNGNESRSNFQDKSIVATNNDQACTSE